MAISLYTGTPGAGKTYEVVRYVIVPAVAAGRRVVTNIAGLDGDVVRDFCVEELKAVPGKLGDIVVVDDSQVESPGFFPAAGIGENVVAPGDLVVIDECWRYWGADMAISQEEMSFFRKHRHLTDSETGVSCDLVLISQAPTDIHRKLRNVVELTFRAKKAKGLGLSSVYVVEMWEGSNLRKKAASNQTRRYDKKVFPLYKSYSGGTGSNGHEMTVDARQNVLKSWRFMLVIPAGLLFIGFAIWNTMHFFSGPASASAEKQAAQKADRIGTEANSGVTPSASIAAATITTPKEEPLSKEWRLSGFISFGDRRVVILINSAGRLRYVSPAMFAFTDGRPVSGVVDGERVTSWTGSLAGPSMPSMTQMVGLGSDLP